MVDPSNSRHITQVFNLHHDLYLPSDMSSRTYWINSQIAVDDRALAAGDGCHREEAKALDDYLSNDLTVQEAAERIVSFVLGEADPASELYRLWSLLSDALVELTDNRQKILELLAAMQSLPSDACIDWSQLADFGVVWSDLNRLHLHGPDPWEKQSWTDDRRAELCHHFKTVGRIEAEMFLRGLGGVTADWGYEVINLSLPLEETRSYTRPVLGARNGLQQAVTCTMCEHWQTWKEALLELGGDRSPLSAESRNIAALSHPATLQVQTPQCEMADWSTLYLAALDVRDRREFTHKSCIDAYTRLADRKSTAPASAIPGTTPAISSDQASNDEINRLRQDLSTTQAARSALSTQLLASQTTSASLTTSNATLTQQLTSVHRQLAFLERKLKDRDEELREKKKLAENVQDEVVALTIQLNAVDREKEKLKGDNAELVRRWMERMRSEVERTNRESGWE
ncbi:ATG16-domain-containing protein [Aureobasidium namibiae CBS 147.97]|uniref:ATG16-domain-containing protein n=1 Tax=Aureobasidium namibiae CBS 147.97 TaxID=1043004 RepID=A0A074X7Y1_9PEZI